MTTVAVIGLGEAGKIYAQGLAEAEFEVRGFDPFTVFSGPGVRQCGDLAEALHGADLVISLVGAEAAGEVLENILSRLAAKPVVADFNTGSPEAKRRLERRAQSYGVPFVDVAVLAPVPRRGVRTPLLVSGTGAEAFLGLCQDLETEIDRIHGSAGEAAARKLLRSVFMKGLAAAVLESMSAAAEAKCEPWLRAQIAAELSEDPGMLIDRLIEGSKQHADRRLHEVEDARELLDSLGQPAWVTQSAGRWLESLSRSRGGEPMSSL